MTLYLVRHAKAGSRSEWSGNDTARPLSKAGRRQADALVDLLAAAQPTRILSSPYARCIATVEPVAAKLGLDVERDDALGEGAPLERSWSLVSESSDSDVVVCSHGDVIGDLVMHVSTFGVALPSHLLQKASTWVVEFDGGRPIGARYVPPPG